MIDSSALPNGGIRIQIDRKSADLPPDLASAFISGLLHQMQQQAEKLGDSTPLGGAIIYPDSCAVEKDRETGEPRLMLGFGKSLLVVSMPAGLLKEVAKRILET